MIFEFEETPIRNARMKVVGVGGAGGNAVNRMIDSELDGVEFISMNTDAQALKSCQAQITLQIGKKLTRVLARVRDPRWAARRSPRARTKCAGRSRVQTSSS